MARTKKVQEEVQEDVKVEKGALVVSPPNLQRIIIYIVGISKLVHNRFTEKVKSDLEGRQREGTVGKVTRRKQDSKDFELLGRASLHMSEDGWYGIPCAAFRAAMISACRVAGVMMSRAKLTIKVVADGIESDGTDLVKITKGKPVIRTDYVRLPNGNTDMRPRGQFDPGWEAAVTIEYDADQLSAESIYNLMLRVGMQVGLLEGRNDSRKSCGQGWGSFDVLNKTVMLSKESEAA